VSTGGKRSIALLAIPGCSAVRGAGVTDTVPDGLPDGLPGGVRERLREAVREAF
jgi:hypothetical protein